MGKIAFIIGESFIYWQSLILMLGAATAIFLFLALYIGKSGNAAAAAVTVPLALITSLLLARLCHWYCQATAYESFSEAMTDWSTGNFALMGVFGGCLLTACLLRLLGLVKKLPEMLDCMALAGAAGIAVGRLSFLYSSADRGMILENITALPMAYPVVNGVTGAVEYRLATFMLQSITAGAIFLVLLAVWLVGRRSKKLPDGDVALCFLLMYGATQALFDSTRYDSLFLRSNGFVSAVQILGLVAIVVVSVIFSVRMVKHGGFKGWHVALWVAELATLGGAGYMEYYVQRHGDRAAIAYSIMGTCLVGTMLLVILVCRLGIPDQSKKQV